MPKKYTLDFIPEEAKQESFRQGFHRKTEQILNFPTFLIFQTRKFRPWARVRKFEIISRILDFPTLCCYRCLCLENKIAGNTFFSFFTLFFYIPCLRLYQENFGKPEYSKLPETYALYFSGLKEFNTDIQAVQFYKENFENPELSKFPEKYALKVGPKEPNIDIEAAQFYMNLFGNPQYVKLPEKYALDVGPKEHIVDIDVSQLYKKNYGNPPYFELPQQYAFGFIPEEAEIEKKNNNVPK